MFPGVMTALITPFDEQCRLDEEGLRQNVKFQIMNKINGLVPLGTTGEAPTLTAKEKTRVIEITLEEADGQLPVFVGTGSYATQATIENTLQAKQMGATGALIVTPYYNKPTQEGIYRHFMCIAEAVEMPIIVYNNQARTGQNAFVSTLQRLACNPYIVGVKDSSGSILQMMDVYESICMQNKDFCLLSGDDPFTYPCMSVGGHGVISVVSNLLPGPIVAMVNAYLEGNHAKAMEMHYKLLPLFKAAFIETNPIPIKAAMQYACMPAGGCRLPLCEISDKSKVILENSIEQVNSRLLSELALLGKIDDF